MEKPEGNKKERFLSLMEEHQDIIHHICRAYANADDYQDLFQEILMQLWRAFDSFRQQSKFSTWMYRVALNTAISAIRKNNKQVNNVSLIHASGIEWEQNKDLDAELKILHGAISQLGKIDKAVILLYLEERHYDEIAEILGISKSNVGVRINRAKAKLEKMLKPLLTLN